MFMCVTRVQALIGNKLHSQTSICPIEAENAEDASDLYGARFLRQKQKEEPEKGWTLVEAIGYPKPITLVEA